MELPENALRLRAMLILQVAALSFVLPLSACLGGQGYTTGAEEGLWDEGGYAVLIGTIHVVTHHAHAPGYAAQLTLRASLCGTIDPSLEPELKADFAYGLTSSIRTCPAEGATVMVVYYRNEYDSGIVSDVCTFMPESSALVTINGLDDPRVEQTLKRLQAARKAGAAKRAATSQGSPQPSQP